MGKLQGIGFPSRSLCASIQVNSASGTGSLFSLYSPQLLDGRGVGSARNHLGEFFTECSLWGCCQRLPLHGSVCPKHHVPAVT